MENQEKVQKIKALVHQIDNLEKELEELVCGGPQIKTINKQRASKVSEQIVTLQQEIAGIEPSVKKRGRPVGWKPGTPYRDYWKREEPKEEEQESGLVNMYCNDCGHNFTAQKPTLDVVCPGCQSVHVLKCKYQEFE